MNLLILGITGKAGRAIARGVQEKHRVVAGVAPHTDYEALRAREPDLPEVPVYRNVSEVPEDLGVEAAIDFTVASAAAENVAFLLTRGIPVLVGTTGISEEVLQRWRMLAIANETGVLYSSNFSLGADLLAALLRQASRFFDFAEIVEIHHTEKRDAPSGTAYFLAQRVQVRRHPGELQEEARIQGVRGAVLGKTRVHAVRLPGFVGTHQVLLASENEVLILEHRALNRQAFVEGVLLALEHLPTVRGLQVGIEELVLRR